MDTSLKNSLAIYKYAFKLKQYGKTPDGIKQELLLQGLDDKSAQAITDNIELHYASMKKKVAKSNLAYGAAWLAAGLSYAMFLFRNPVVSRYPIYMALGITLYGTIRLCKALLP